MNQKIITMIVLILFSSGSFAYADVVLTFDQSGVAAGTTLEQSYGDRVVSSLDGNGHEYDIIAGAGLGLTPNVEVSFGALDPRIWTFGYSNLENVYYEGINVDSELEISFKADSGFEVGLFGFDMGAFGSDTTVAGLEVLDGNNNVLWSQGSTLISASATGHSSFDFAQGLFAEELSVVVDLSGLGGGSDNISIDNVHFAQRVASVPEPASVAILNVIFAGVILRRKRG